MALNYSAGGGGSDFEPVPAGTHAAVCTLVADVGIQPGTGAYPKDRAKVWLRFEIPTERVKWTKDGQDYDKPAIVYENFTASVAPKALLRHALEAWYGRGFTDEEASRIDVTKVAGRPALISVIHNKSGGRTYANISTIAPLMKGMHPPIPENPIVIFHEGDQSQFDLLPKFLQEKWTNRLAPVTEDDVDEQRAAEYNEPDTSFVDDDLPF